MSATDTDLYGKKTGINRTDVYCHQCSHNFIAHINYDVEGNHVVECPYCGHCHYRIIKAGKVTEDRYSSDHSTHKDRAERGMWKSNSVPMATSTVAHFLRNRWLNHGNEEAE
jgi:DNA-directed RNA polymerase subunit RPC12/RpoP